MSRNTYIVPSVYPQELDLSGRASPQSATIMMAAFPSRRGPLTDQFITDDVDFEDLYGKEDYTWTFAHSMIKAYLKKGTGAWLRRVTKNARHAGMVIANNLEGAQATATSFWPFNSGRYDDYVNGPQEYQHLILSAALVTGNTIAVTLTSDNTSTITLSQAFVSNSDNTLRLLAAQINTALTTSPFVGAGKNVGGAAVIEGGSALDDSRIIRVISPEDSAVILSNYTVTGGASQATIAYENSPWLMEIYAENPGKWGNDLGIKIMNVDNGVRQRQLLTFAAPITSGGSFSTDYIKAGIRTTVGPVNYSTDMATTAALIRDALIASLGFGSDAWVVSGSNGLQIMVVSPIDGPNSVQFINPQVTGGGAPAVTVTETLSGIDKDDTFEVWVYERDNVNVAKEKHKVSFVKQKDGYGRQLFISDAINTSGSRSDRIRVNYNTLNSAGILNGIPAEGTPIYWFSGGDDGTLPSNSELAAAWESSFRSRRKRPGRLMMDCGHTSPTIHQKIDYLCQKRWDCFGILSMPSDKQRTTDALDYRNNLLNINSSYSAIYTPDVQITTDDDSLVYIPPAGHVAAQFAYNDEVAAEWFSPAGLNRGLITEIQGLREEYEEGDMELLIAKQINPIVKEPGKGYQIKSAETLQAKQSHLSNINVRRLLIVIEVTLVEGLDYTIHEPNDAFTRFLIVQMTTNFLQPIKVGRGLYDFAIVCDERNTKDYHIDMGQANLDVYLKPVLPIKFLQLTSVITATGAFFQETIAALNGA